MLCQQSISTTLRILFCAEAGAKKQWDQTRSFVKKHKKAIIIGTIVVVTVATVVVAAVAISASAAGTAAACGAASLEGAAQMPSANNRIEKELLSSSLKEEISSFKEIVVKEELISEINELPIEESGRVIGSVFAHKTIETLKTSGIQNQAFREELKDFGFYPNASWQLIDSENPHHAIDLAFSTEHQSFDLENFDHSNAIFYQARGRLAKESQCYDQAIEDFQKAIKIHPNDPILHLEKGITNFELGHYEASIADYFQYIEKKKEPFSITDFSIGFAKGVPKGAYESGTHALLFLADFIAHPVHSSQQIVDSMGQLATLVKNDQFGVIAETLSPELHQLITQWDTLPSTTRGELAGYAVGKLGTDILSPGAIAKVASKSLKSAKDLAAICRDVQIAQETLILETASGIAIPAKASELISMSKKTLELGEELGFTSQEIGQLQKTRQLEKVVSNVYEHLTPGMRESFELFEKAQDFLKPYKGFMSESQARELIHQTGIRTFPRPWGIPENFRVKISDRGAGMKYVHPTDQGTYIRVIPGKPHSPFSYQQRPYVSHVRNGNYLDKNGNIVNRQDITAHIPIEEFVF